MTECNCQACAFARLSTAQRKAFDLANRKFTLREEEQQQS